MILNTKMTSFMSLMMMLCVCLSAKAAKNGQAIVKENCAPCHETGVMEAPKMGSKSDWEPRLKQGYRNMVKRAVDGYKNMPAKGGNPLLKPEEVAMAVDHMLVKAGLVETDQPTTDKKSATDKKPPTKKVEKDATKAIVKAVKKKPKKTANSFNRLMKSKSDWNPPPQEDGIHDPDNESTYMLQTPREAFSDIDKNPFGNHVDWVKALNKGLIDPRFDRLDPEKSGILMDLNIIREVKGSMPDVVYPHKQHTQWLDCSNCHPSIFIPQKGANSISMASILMGKQCGVCHGKVAFPVAECRRCHSLPKQKTDLAR